MHDTVGVPDDLQLAACLVVLGFQKQPHRHGERRGEGELPENVDLVERAPPSDPESLALRHQLDRILIFVDEKPVAAEAQ
ncbi:hypothetical protein [Streptomyces sp. NBC_00366]|uniref:hypothetical protein n=1 Tax=Streptomyces sp. NBC_00366 TaxID=2975727 RepID=UPI002E27104C